MMKHRIAYKSGNSLNVYKKSLCLLIIISLSNYCFSQHRFQSSYGKRTAIDDCLYHIEYNYNYYRRYMVEGEQYRYKDIHALDIGTNVTRYYSVLGEKYDSLAKVVYDEAVKNNSGGGFNIQKELGLDKNEKPTYEDVFFNYPQKGMSLITAMIKKYEYRYEEPIPEMSWGEISAQDTVIQGYQCFSTLTTFRGREYKVWFTPELPLSYGPWKFHGLPGLIVKVEELSGLFGWEITKLEKCDGKKIILAQSDPVVKCTRKEYRKIRTMEWKDPVSLSNSQGITYADRTPTGGVKILKPGEKEDPEIPSLELE